MRRSRHDRRRTPGSIAKAAGIAVVLALGASCSAPTVLTREFTPNAQPQAEQELTVEMLAATYDERQLTVRAAVSNTGADPVVIVEAGILLGYGGLEFPLATPGPEALRPGDVELAPAERRELWLTFQPGSRLHAEGTLVLRSIRRGDQWLAPVTMPVAPSPKLAVDDEA